MFASFARGPATFDAGPYTCPEGGVGAGHVGFADITGRTATAVLDPSKSTIVLLVIGQSNAISIAPGTAFVPSAGTENFNFYDSKNYVAKDPLLGTETVGGTVYGDPGSSFATRLGSKMVDAGMAQRAVVVNAAVGATTIADWAPGGRIAGRLRFVLRRMQQAGLRPGFIIQTQGESDAIAGTSAATYAATQRTVVEDIRRNGSSAPFFLSQTTVYAGVSTGNRNTVRQGQADACSDPLGIFLGPDTDTLTGANRQADSTHLSVAGIDAAADLWLATLQAWVAAHTTWPVLL